MGRTPLSEEAEREESEDRERLRALETKLRELGSRRQLLLDQVHELSDQQKALYDQRAPHQVSLEKANDEHRNLGRQLAEVRTLRDRARARLEQALGDLRSLRGAGPGGDRVRPEMIRKEMAELEMRQQTNALPLSEENALIDRLRALSKALADAERDQAVVAQFEARRTATEDLLRGCRAEVDQLNAAFQRFRVEREAKMESMRAQLLEEGHLVAQIREKGRARTAMIDRFEETNRQFQEQDREVGQILNASRQRRQEARRAMSDYNRSVRDTVTGPSAYERTAEAQLAELLKRGKVTLNP